MLGRGRPDEGVVRRPAPRVWRGWCSWSTSTRATATLVSTSAAGRLPLVRLAEGTNVVVGDPIAARRDDEAPRHFREILGGQRLHPEPAAVDTSIAVVGVKPQARYLPRRGFGRRQAYRMEPTGFNPTNCACIKPAKGRRF